MKKLGILCMLAAVCVVSVILLSGCQSQNKPPEGMTPQWYYNEGCQLFNSWKIGPAIDYLTKAIELDPTYAEAYAERGLCYFNLCEYGNVVNDYNECFRLKPEYSNDTYYAYVRTLANCVLTWRSENLVGDVFFKEHEVTSGTGESYKFDGVTAVVPEGTLSNEREATLLIDRMNADLPVLIGTDGLLITLCEQENLGPLSRTNNKSTLFNYGNREYSEGLINHVLTTIPECP